MKTKNPPRSNIYKTILIQSYEKGNRFKNLKIAGERF